MQVLLNAEDSRTLHEILEASLVGLKRELAGTDLPVRELRAELHKRIKLSEGLLAELEPAIGVAKTDGR